MSTKILINENQTRQNELLDQATDSVKIINSRLVAALSEIGVELTTEVLKDCLTGANEARVCYFKQVDKDNLKIRTNAIKKHLYSQAVLSFEAFENELNKIRYELKQTQYLTIEDGLCVLSTENKEKLLDSARIYITDPAEIEKYKLHKEAAEALNRLFNGNIPYKWHVIFEERNGCIQINDNTNYSILTNHGN